MKQRIEDLKIYHTLCKVMSKTQAKCELMKVINCKDSDFYDLPRLSMSFYWSLTPQGWDFWGDINLKLQQLED